MYYHNTSHDYFSGLRNITISDCHFIFPDTPTPQTEHIDSAWPCRLLLVSAGQFQYLEIGGDLLGIAVDTLRQVQSRPENGL